MNMLDPSIVLKVMKQMDLLKAKSTQVLEAEEDSSQSSDNQ